MVQDNLENTNNKVNLIVEPLKPLMAPGEVWITNAADGNSKSWQARTHRENEKSAQQFVDEVESYIAKGVSKWESIRIIGKAFDIQGNPVKGMVALVGIPKSKA